MSRPTHQSQFGRKLAAAQLREGFATAPTPQPALLPSLPSGDLDRGNAHRLLVLAWARKVWAVVRQRHMAQRGRGLRVVETVGLGEKRLLAIVRVRDEEFLIGSAPAGLTLLTRLRGETAASSGLTGAGGAEPLEETR